MKLKLVVALALAAGLSACASTDPRTALADPTAGLANLTGTAAQSQGMAAEGLHAHHLGGAAAEKAAAIDAVAGKSVYFGFDKSTVDQAYYPVVEAHAAVVRRYGAEVLIQGNTDQKGSREYNLALGQRRAESVKQALMAVGAPADKLEAVSLGEQKPVSSDDAKNRRADILYTSAE